MGIERGMRIPDSGDIVRSYSVYNDKSAHVSTLTLTKVDHLAGKCEVEDLFNTKTQTKISTIAAHIVQPNKLTFAEHDLLDRCTTTADQKLSGIYALHPRAIKVAPKAELIREDEEIEIVDLRALVSTRFLSPRVVPKKRLQVRRRVKRLKPYRGKHSPLAAVIRRNLALSIFGLASMLAGAKAGTASDSEGGIGDQMSPGAIQHRALQRTNQSSRGATGRASPGSGGGRRGPGVEGQVGAGTLGDTIAPND